MVSVLIVDEILGKGNGKWKKNKTSMTDGKKEKQYGRWKKKTNMENRKT